MSIKLEKTDFDFASVYANDQCANKTAKEVPAWQVKKDIDNLLKNDQIKTAVTLLASV